MAREELNNEIMQLLETLGFIPEASLSENP